MATRLADIRTETLDDAKATFRDLAQATLRMERRAAGAEVRIAAIKDKLALDNHADAEVRAVAEASLSAFILAHRDMFKRPRQVATEFGRFGLRDATRLEVDDAEALVEALMDLGYEDCIETRRSLAKAAIRKRIEGGELIPGARILSGDLATYTVDKALMDQAREEVA